MNLGQFFLGSGLGLGLVTSHFWVWGLVTSHSWGCGFWVRVGDIPFFRFGLGLVTLVSQFGVSNELSRVMILIWLDSNFLYKARDEQHMTKSTKP